MTSFLKMCCNWGELFIFLYHFKSNEENISNCLSSDILNENYLHNYLNADQWNTIEQRIANFGELPCKQHLKKISSQTSRLTILCERKMVDPNLLKLYSYSDVNLQITKDISDINIIAKNILNLKIEKDQTEVTEEELSNLQTIFNEDVTSEICNIEMKNIVNLLNVLKQLPLAYCSDKIRVEMILLSIVNVNKTNFSIETKKMIRSITYRITVGVSEIFTEEHLKNGNIKLELYGLTIDRCLIRDKKNILDNLLKYFDKVLSLCLEVGNSKNEENVITVEDKTEFLNVVVKNMKKLDANLPEDFILKCALNNAENALFNFSSLVSHSQLKELELIINYLLDKTKLHLKNNSMEEFSRNIDVWEIMVEHKFNKTKSQIRQNALQIILREFLFSIKTSPYNFQMSIIMLKYIHKLLRTQVVLTPTMIDLILELLYEINHKRDSLQQDISEFESIFSISTFILDVFFTFRSVLIMDRIQSILVPYRLLLKKLCLRSQIQSNKNEENIISKCALNFQRTNENLVKHKKDTARIAPYLIADVLQYYEKVTFYPTIKNYLNSCLYGLLNLCDSHANSFLLRNLSIPSKEIFKVIHDDFNKYHRFTGKS
ncbi:uncharacterized protein LOC123292579 [Chrysoperla carnea]|uniref:uncharacterized protein LOC123292579 n=1 Tax=Chrysoperla carnea TaxID=189513 RepID=UPI001D083F18|nr:uncharacterized protein LOC123292579 [Chrysoperla carnea]